MPHENSATPPIFTIPNLLCIIRFIGSPFLIVLAAVGMPYWFVALYIFLMLTDWFDGKLAVLWNQQSAFGARVDSLADFTMYTSLSVGILVLKGEELLDEWPWIAAALASYGATNTAALLKFRRLPSYHTRLAKISWFVVAIGAISFLLNWSDWPLRIALAVVTLTNLEATAITFVLNERRVDIPSIFHAISAEK